MSKRGFGFLSAVIMTVVFAMGGYSLLENGMTQLIPAPISTSHTQEGDACCLEYDGGQNFFERSVACDSSNCSEDVCLDSSDLKEYFCQNNRKKSIIYECDFCLNGACVTGGARFPLFTTSSKLYLNDSISKVRSVVTDVGLPAILADGVFDGTSYQQKMSIGSYPKTIFAQQPTNDDDPQIGIRLANTCSQGNCNYLYNATVVFSRSVNFTLPEIVGENIVLFGKDFIISDETDISKLVLEGDRKIILRDGSPIKVGIDKVIIDGTNVDFDKTTYPGNISKITIQVTASDSDSDAIVEGDVFVDPVFESFGVDFEKTSIPIDDTVNRENINIDSDGDDEMTLSLREHQGYERTTNWLLSYGNGNSVLADSGGDLIKIRERDAVNRSYYVVLGNENEGGLFEVVTITNSTSGFSNDAVSLKNVFSGEIIDAIINAEGEGFFSVLGRKYNFNYYGPSIIEQDSRIIRVDYPDSDGQNMILFPTIETSKGSKLSFIEKQIVNLTHWQGGGLDRSASSDNITGFLFPDGDGYTTITASVNATELHGIGNWTINNEYLDFQGYSAGTKNTTNINVGTVNYILRGITGGLVDISLMDLSGKNITLTKSALLIFEEESDGLGYEALIVETEGEGTRFDGVGVSEVERTWSGDSEWDEIRLESDSDFFREMDRWGTLITLDKSNSDQITTNISYNDVQVQVEIYVVEIF